MSTNEFFRLDNEIIKNNFVMKEKNFMIWPIVRWEVLNSSLHSGISVASKKNFRYIYYNLKYAPHRLNKKYKIFYYVNARGRLNNKNYNIYSDYYSSLIKNSLVIDSSFGGCYYIPDHTDNFATGDYFAQIKILLLYLIKKIFSKKQSYVIRRFIEFLKIKDTIDKDFAEKIRNFLYDFYYIYDYCRSYITKVFKKLDPKIIFVHAAAYGGRYQSILLKTAKENGIITGEFQHGSISKSHMAYNYGDLIFKSEEYKKYLPDYILTYGDYWNEQIKIPSKKITIGNPHFYECIKKYTHIKEHKNTVLIVSQTTITDKFVKIAKYLSEKLQNYKILFKLHPMEVFFEDRYKDLYKYNNIQIAKTGDIYEYIAKYENIVACYSTTIFEALGFNKKIFILDNEWSKKNIPENIGLRFKENKELKELILNTKKQDDNYDLEYYFNSNWKENYKRFLKDEVGIE